MSLRNFFGRMLPSPPTPRPLLPATLTDMLLRDAPSQRDVRMVRDVAQHVASKVVPIVELHGRTMETALQANVMAIEVALRLGLEAAQRTALTALVKGEGLDAALAKLDAAILTIAQGLADHRCEIAAAIEAASLGIEGGSVRQ